MPTDLTPREAPLEMTAQAFRDAGHRLVDELALFLESLPRRAVTVDEPPTAVRALLPGAWPDESAEPRGAPGRDDTPPFGRGRPCASRAAPGTGG